MIDHEMAQHLAQAWIDAWNRHDLDAVMAHYAEDVEFYSPLIVKRLGIASGKITGKAQLKAYFEGGLAAQSALHFTLIQLLPGVDSLTLYYRRQDGTEVAEMMVLNADHRVSMVRNHYSLSNSVWQP